MAHKQSGKLKIKGRNGNITGWFTMNGRHIPIMSGQTKSTAAKKFIANKNTKPKIKKAIKYGEYEYKKARKNYNKTMKSLEKLYANPTKFKGEYAMNTNTWLNEKAKANNKLAYSTKNIFKKNRKLTRRKK